LLHKYIIAFSKLTLMNWTFDELESIENIQTTCFEKGQILKFVWFSEIMRFVCIRTYRVRQNCSILMLRNKKNSTFLNKNKAQCEFETYFASLPYSVKLFVITKISLLKKLTQPEFLIGLHHIQMYWVHTEE
jgi:hypothetical protein